MAAVKKLDYLIVGGGLAGLQLLKAAKDSGAKSLLIEKSDQLGGSLMELEEQSARLESLIWLKSSSTQSLLSCGPQLEAFTLGKKKNLVPFVGFGDKKIDTLEIVQDFLDADSKCADFKQKLFLEPSDYKKNISYLSEITAIDSISFDEGQEFARVTLNGKEILEVKTVLWTAPLNSFENLIPKDHFNTFRNKFKKSKAYDALSVHLKIMPEIDPADLAQKKMIFFGENDLPWLSLLKGGSESAHEFIATSFFSESLSADHDFIRKHIKSLKRQVKNMLLQLSDLEEPLEKSERLVVHKAVASNFKMKAGEGPLKNGRFQFFCGDKSSWPSPFEQNQLQLQDYLSEEFGLNPSELDLEAEAAPEAFSEDPSAAEL